MSRIQAGQPVDHDGLRHRYGTSVARAFTRGSASDVTCGANVALCKVTVAAAVAGGTVRPAPGTAGVSPWWFSHETVTVAAPGGTRFSLPGLAEDIARAQRTGSPLRSYMRARGAVCLDWNRMTHVLVAVLRRDVAGIVGQCSGQPLVDKIERLDDPAVGPVVRQWVGGHAGIEDVHNVRFIGGHWQLYLPHLQPSDLDVVSFTPLALDR
jgi:hypothetical protein